MPQINWRRRRPSEAFFLPFGFSRYTINYVILPHFALNLGDAVHDGLIQSPLLCPSEPAETSKPPWQRSRNFGKPGPDAYNCITQPGRNSPILWLVGMTCGDLSYMFHCSSRRGQEYWHFGMFSMFLNVFDKFWCRCFWPTSCMHIHAAIVVAAAVCDC